MSARAHVRPSTRGHATVATYQREWRAQEVRKLRARLNLSQEGFARLLGTTVSSVNRWERGKTVPSHMAAKLLERIEREGSA